MALSIVPVDDSFSSTPSSASKQLIRVAFVNNMPDGAFDATQRQFLDLLSDAAPADIEIRSGATHGRRSSRRPVAARVADDYLSTEPLREDPPDVVIVTGSSRSRPTWRTNRTGPRWSSSPQWARVHVPSMVLSCLAAHAALDIFHGVRREHLDRKFTGVFNQVTSSDHPLVQGMASSLVLPHSRTNTVDDDRLREVGYDIAMWCEPSGWSVASRRLDGCEVVLIQGHPEYDPASLLFEYRRDARRFANAERDDEPPLPANCASGSDWTSLEALHRQLLRTRHLGPGRLIRLCRSGQSSDASLARWCRAALRQLVE